MSKFTIKHLPEDDILEIEGETCKLANYDAFTHNFKGRIEAFLNDRSPTWHYYELEPGRNDRAQVFYGPIETKRKDDPENKKLLKELRVMAERCHNWIMKQEKNKWKRLQAPIEEGIAVKKVANAEYQTDERSS